MLFTNSRVRRRLAMRNPMTIKIALPLDDHRKLEAFVALFAQIDKRNKCLWQRNQKSKTKAKDALVGQYKKRLAVSRALSFIIKYFIMHD